MDGNYAGSASVYKHTRVVDTTIGPHVYKLDGKAGSALGAASSGSAIIANSLILGKFSKTLVSITVSNCVLIAGNSDMFSSTQNCVVATLDQVALDDDLRPIAGKSVACDLADASLRTSEGTTIAAMVDALRKRANNGCRLDAGALEADWRGVYAQDVGGKAFSVSAADNAVEESSTHTVLVPEGSSMTGRWSNGTGREMDFLMRFVVPAGGSLDVTVGGATRTFAEGTHEYTVSSAADTLDVAFASTAGTAEILRGRRLMGTTLIIR